MTNPRVRGRIVAASRIVSALGDALQRIKSEDDLTWPDVGAALGKSDDRAALYAAGAATMDVVTYYRGKQAWNGRFTDAADKLIADAAGEVDERHAQSCLAKATWALSVALEDGKLSNAEIAANRSDLERAQDMIGALLGRLKPTEVRS